MPKKLLLLLITTYINILPKNFVDIALSPQRLTVSMVLQHLAKGDVPQEVMLKMQSGAEAIEGIIHNNEFTKNFFDRPIAEIPLPDNCVIAAVIRQDKTFMNSENLLLKPDDKIIVFILGKTDKEQMKSFSKEMSLKLVSSFLKRKRNEKTAFFSLNYRAKYVQKIFLVSD